jgi:hypothetical protein
LVEACADGWWYSALLPGQRLIAVYTPMRICCGAIGKVARAGSTIGPDGSNARACGCSIHKPSRAWLRLRARVIV